MVIEHWNVNLPNIKMILRNKFVGSTGLVVLIRFANVFISFFLSVVLLRTLGLKSYGIYAIYLAIMAMLVVPITSGIPNLIVRQTSPDFQNKNYNRVRGILRVLLRIMAMYFTIVAITLSLISFFELGGFSPVLLVLIIPHVILQCLSAVRSAVLRSAGEIVRGQILERLFQPSITVMGNLILFSIFRENFEIYHAVGALLFSHAVVMGVGGIWVRRYAVSFGPSSNVDPRPLLIEAFHLSGSSLMSTALLNGIVLMIGSFVSPEASGLYRIATSVALPIVYIHEVLGQVIAPNLAQRLRDNNGVAIRKILKVGALVSLSGSVLGGLITIFFGKFLLDTVYGPQSAGAFAPMMVLAASHVANAAGGLDHEVLNMSGKAKNVLRITTYVTGFCFALSVPSIHIFGLIGAVHILLAYQVLISYLLSKEALRVSGYNPSLLPKFFLK